MTHRHDSTSTHDRASRMTVTAGRVRLLSKPRIRAWSARGARHDSVPQAASRRLRPWHGDADTELGQARDDCNAMSEALAGLAGEQSPLSSDQQRHLQGCLRCRAERARYTRLMDAIRALRELQHGPDAELESQILSHLDRFGDAPTSRVASRASAALGGLAAGAAARCGRGGIGGAAPPRRTPGLSAEARRSGFASRRRSRRSVALVA